MRDLLYKNLTSGDRRRKIISACEIADKQGVRSVVRRHFSCMIKEVSDPKTLIRPKPYLYVLKERDTKLCREHFFCKIKSSILATHNNSLYLVLYAHTLSIELTVSEASLK